MMGFFNKRRISQNILVNRVYFQASFKVVIYIYFTSRLDNVNQVESSSFF